MALLEKWLFIKKSKLPFAGLGLFTKKFIPKGSRILEYKGRVRTWKEVQYEHWENRYIFYINKNRVIDAMTYKRSLARYVNDAQGIKKIRGIINNTHFIEDDGRVYIEAIKDINAGDELFVGYGKDYWDAVKKNEQ